MRNDDLFGKPALTAYGHHTVAGSEVLDADAHGLDRAGDFSSGRKRECGLS